MRQVLVIWTIAIAVVIGGSLWVNAQLNELVAQSKAAQR